MTNRTIERCCWIRPVYYGNKSGAFRGDPYKNARDYYFECTDHNRKAKKIKDLCEGCKDYFHPKIDKPQVKDHREIREITVTDKGIVYTSPRSD